jgi:uncharacterized coiled-coil protein SlyX
MSGQRRAASRVRPPVRRGEFTALETTVADVERTLDRLNTDLETQFKRIAQLQAQIDQLQTAWKKQKRS